MKYALVTGASLDLGKLIVDSLVNNGYTVFATDSNISNIEESKKIIPIKMDVTDTFSIEECYEKVKEKTSHLDVVLNFTDILIMNSLIETDMGEVEKIFNVNVMGIMRVNKRFFPLILSKKGRIINISSELGWMSPTPFNGLYTMTKYALEAYNDTLRRELNDIGIKVIKIQLGSFKPNMHEEIKNNYTNLVNNTKYFKKNLNSLHKFITKEFKHNNPKYLIKVILDACNNPKPKICYRVKNNLYMRIINLLPEKIIDNIYKKSI